MPRSYRSPQLAAIHETVSGLAEIGLIDKRIVKDFDAMCLSPIEDLSPEQIRDIRLHEGVSQAMFARYLNVTAGLASQWERVTKRPRGASLKLLTLVARKGLQAVA